MIPQAGHSSWLPVCLEVGHELAVEADHAKMSQDRDDGAIDLDHVHASRTSRVRESELYITYLSNLSDLIQPNLIQSHPI